MLFYWFCNFYDVQALGVPRSGKWRPTRKNHLIKEPCCQICASKKKLEVHHIIPFSIDPSKELLDENLVTLCIYCHFIFGHLGKWASYNENLREDIEIWSKKIKERP
ncbi:MAG: HNH endonuclease [Candidatus Aenigmarchaeota archaeon]|nr:HNH endonuclease [Candidatus Aenigmarchaeota archaeon]